MIPYDLDPSLHTGEPESPLLEDGFSPPQHHGEGDEAPVPPVPHGGPVDPAFWVKSGF